ncbi:MAG TPA: GNAT family N-acetyltransferase [Firmicutes bacterium]|jgi:GNAT superfamily N-acetyltransferase|nr:GNAT family N-acetyltransferase [Bacillota bacterium]
MANQIEIRKASPEDASALADLALQLGHKEEAGKVRDRLLLLLSKGQVVFVAVEKRQIVGWVHGYIYSLLYQEPMGEIAALVVEKGYRRMGIGRMLVEAFEQWVKAKGCNGVFLRSNIKREEAHKFYQALGYDLVKTQHIFSKELLNDH